MFHSPSGTLLSPTWSTSPSPRTFATNDNMLNALSSWFGISIPSLNNYIFPSPLKNRMPEISPMQLSTWFSQQCPEPAQTRSQTLFPILNRDHETATKTEKLAKGLVSDGTIDNLHSCNTSPSTLLEAQIALFELAWSGTIERLKSNSTHNAEDPEYEKLRQTLDQLDKSPQEIPSILDLLFHISSYVSFQTGCQDAMNELRQSLREVEILLDTQRADHSRPSPNQRAYDRSSNYSHIPFTERGSVVSDLEDITGNLRNNPQNAKRAFKLIPSLNNNIFPSPLRDQMPEIPPMQLSTWFIQNLSATFAISRLAQSRSHAPFLILNCDHKTATKAEELAKSLNSMIGKDMLPSGGKYACKGVCLECLHGSLELPSIAWPYRLVREKEQV